MAARYQRAAKQQEEENHQEQHQQAHAGDASLEGDVENGREPIRRLPPRPAMKKPPGIRGTHLGKRKNPKRGTEKEESKLHNI
jgi:hypothetical protein